MITLARIPDDYKHPMNWSTIGEWGIYEDSRLVITGSLIELLVYFKQVICL